MVGVLFRLVYLVDETLWLLLEDVGEQGVNLQTDGLFAERTLRCVLEGDAYIVFVVNMLEVLLLRFHLAPDAVRTAVIDFGYSFYAVGMKSVFYCCGKLFQSLGVEVSLLGYGIVEFGIFSRATVLEPKVFEVCLDVVQSEAVGKRCIEIVCLASYLHLFVRTHA